MKIFLPNVGFNPVMFVFTGWAGTFLLSVYLLKIPSRTRTMYLYLIIGLLIAVIGDGVAPLFVGAGAIGFFCDYLSFNIVIASAALLLILAAVPVNRLQSRNPVVNRVVNWIGKNTSKELRRLAKIPASIITQGASVYPLNFSVNLTDNEKEGKENDKQ